MISWGRLIPDRFRSLGVFLILACAAVFVYEPLRHAGFVYDDLWYVVRNDALVTASVSDLVANPETVASPGSTLSGDVYRPLTTLTFALDRRLWGLSPVAYHLENVVLQLFAAFFLFFVLSAVAGRGVGALAGALVFLVHPVQVQSVAWISQRSSVLAGAFGLAAMAVMVARAQPAALRVAAALVLWALALASKESAIVVPLLLGSLALVRPGSVLPDATRGQKITAIAGFAGVACVYLLIRSHFIGLSQTPGEDGPLFWRLALGARAFPLFIGKMLVPAWLRVSYDYPTLQPYRLLGGALLFGALATSAGLLRRRAPLVSVAVLWTLIGTLPFLQIFPVRAFFADRFIYFPLLGLCLAVAWIVGRWTRAALPALVIVAGLALAGRFATRPWMNEFSLWLNVVAQEPTNAFGYACLGQASEDPLVKERAAQAALLNRPSDPVRVGTMLNLAILYHNTGRRARARIWAKRVLQESPANPVAKAIAAPGLGP